jgi:predicted short-subunit dehydrogenase-like oxidoreductase (DUF2520 family)
LDHNPLARAFALVGAGRAGTAVALALGRAGWSARAVAGRAPDTVSTRRAGCLLGAEPVAAADAGRGCELVVVAPPDAEIANVAADVAPSLEPGALVVHLSGARGLDGFGAVTRDRPDVSFGVLHPLQSLPSPELGAARLAGSWCAVDGPDAVGALAVSLGMRPFRVAPERRAVYHASACVASNHVVALLGQVERLATEAGVPFDAFLPLVRATLDNTAELGPAAALTGPVARGDVATVAAHLDALPADERAAYAAGAAAAARLAGRDDPALDALVHGVPA